MLRGEINEILVFPLYNAVSGPFLPTFQPSLHLRHYLRRKCESLLITNYWQWKLDARRLGWVYLDLLLLLVDLLKRHWKSWIFEMAWFDYTAITRCHGVTSFVTSSRSRCKHPVSNLTVRCLALQARCLGLPEGETFAFFRNIWQRIVITCYRRAEVLVKMFKFVQMTQLNLGTLNWHFEE